MADKELSFSDMLGEIGYGDLTEDTKTTDTPAADPAAAPSPESPAIQDTPPEDPKVEAKPADAPTGDPAPTEPVAEVAKPAAPAPVTPDPNEIIEVGDFKGTRAELALELDRRGLRRADYTRKRQEDATARGQAEAKLAEVTQLTKDISQDRALQKFLAAHPEALETLIADPKATRKNLIGNAAAVDEFWSDYEVIQQHPRIAAKLAGEEAEPEEVTAEIQEQRAANAIVTIAEKLQNAVKDTGKQFAGVDPEDVEKYLLELGGADPNKPLDSVEAGRQVFGRLYKMFFVEQGDQLFIDTRLIKDRFQQLKDRIPAPVASAADEHNKKIDEALKAEQPGAATPKGAAPAPAAPKPKQVNSLRDALDDILQPTG